MLAEFFLSPDTFCESDDRLRQLERCLFPFNPRQPSVAILCRLGEDKWTTALGQKIARIKNPNHRMLAMDLMKKIISELTVIRPLTRSVTNDESSWVVEARNSHRDLGFEAIVVSSNITTFSDNCTKVGDFVMPGFWEEFGNPRHVGRDKPAQVRVLRSFCAFSDWIIVRMPQIKGGSDDEIVTVKQIVQLATNLPEGFQKSNVEVQFPINDRAKHDPGRVFRAVKAELKDVVVPGSDLRLTMLPVGSFVNREILGGEYTPVSTGDKLLKARWLLTMNHVAVGGRQNPGRDDANSWNLFSRHEANKRLATLNGLAPLQSEIL